MARITITAFNQYHDKILVSGKIGKSDSFNDLEIEFLELVNWAKEDRKEYCDKYYISDHYDEIFNKDMFDYETFMDEIDEKLILDFILEKDLLTC